MLFSIGATEDAASGRVARPDGTAAFRQTLLGPDRRDLLQAFPELAGVGSQIVEAWELRQALEAEDSFEERRDAVADCAALLPPRLRDQAPLHEPGYDGVGGDPAEPCDVGTRDGPDVGHDRERLESGLRKTALDRAFEEPCTRLGGVASRSEGIAARNALEHDPAPPLAVPLREQAERRLDPIRLVGGGFGEVVERQRLRGDDEQRLEGPRQAVQRVRDDVQLALGCAGGGARELELVLGHAPERTRRVGESFRPRERFRSARTAPVARS